MRMTKQKKLIKDIIDKSYNHLDAYGVYKECVNVIPNSASCCSNLLLILLLFPPKSTHLCGK